MHRDVPGRERVIDTSGLLSDVPTRIGNRPFHRTSTDLQYLEAITREDAGTPLHPQAHAMPRSFGQPDAPIPR